MPEFRVFIYASGLVLPVVVPVSCNTASLIDRLKEIFTHDLIATRADVWDGPRLIMRIDGGGIAGLIPPAVRPAPSDADDTRH
jgi:hypothetical protein